MGEVQTMIHQAPLDKLPPDLRIPEQYRDRFAYDEHKKCLVYRGAMFKRTFDRLRALSDDFAYQRAIERLFQLAVPEPEPTATSRRGKWVAWLAVAGVIVLGGVVLLGLLLHHHA
jgi:hypothetical protein